MWLALLLYLRVNSDSNIDRLSRLRFFVFFISRSMQISLWYLQLRHYWLLHRVWTAKLSPWTVMPLHQFLLNLSTRKEHMLHCWKVFQYRLWECASGSHFSFLRALILYYKVSDVICNCPYSKKLQCNNFLCVYTWRNFNTSLHERDVLCIFLYQFMLLQIFAGQAVVTWSAGAPLLLIRVNLPHWMIAKNTPH